jgi:hypothetical protein
VTFNLDATSRKSLLDFVRPISVGLDGVTNFGYVERRLRVVARVLEETLRDAPGDAIDESRLFLLAAFAGLPERRIDVESRAGLLLKSAKIPFEEVRILVSSVNRYENDPRSWEEKIVHDAVLLESVGAYGVTQLLVSGARERQTLAEMAEEIAEKMAAARFATPAGRRLAADRVAFATLFAQKLAEEAGEFETAPAS